MKTAVLFWPGSEAEIEGMQPDVWFPYNEEMTSEKRVEQLVEWLTSRNRPEFIAAYFSKLDFIGHEFGPDSQEVNSNKRVTCCLGG